VEESAMGLELQVWSSALN